MYKNNQIYYICLLLVIRRKDIPVNIYEMRFIELNKIHIILYPTMAY